MVPQALFGLGTTELIIILVVILVVFGGSKLAGLGKASGQAIREFKEEVSAIKPDATPDAATPAASPDPVGPPQTSSQQ